MSESKLELFKLDPTDRKVLFWMMDNNPDGLHSWIKFITSMYARNKAVSIDSEKFFTEVIVEFPAEVENDSQKDWRPKNILLVDDESIFNFLHTRMLQMTGVTNEIHSALNGVHAIDMLKSYSFTTKVPDVILLDLSMPVMDGFTFIEAFKKIDLPNKENITIIILTSSNDARDLAKAKALGVTHYLIKPVDERELCAAVIGV